MHKNARIFVAGHAGMVGSALVRSLGRNGYGNLIVRTRAELDLTRQSDVESFFDQQRPEFVFLAAAKVGGLMANKTYRADFITTNLQIETNVIHSAWQAGTRKLLFLASSCIYPRECPQPMREDHLWTGRLEPTNSPYAVAKLAGIEMCTAYRDQHGVDFTSVVPCNLYGPNDDYHPENSHVMAALIRKLHHAKVNGDTAVTFWGTGSPRRELLYVDDLADACVHLMCHSDDPGPVNIGSGGDHTIRELIDAVSDVVGYEGQILFDADKPDGVPRKLVDSSKVRGLGWAPATSLKDGIAHAYSDYLAFHDSAAECR